MKDSTAFLASIVCLLANAASADTPVRPVLIGIYAQDFAETVTWYGSNFGFETISEVENVDANLRIAFLDNGAFELEIYSDILPEPGSSRLKRDRFGMPAEGFVKLSLETTDLAELAASLRANEATFVREINESGRKPGQSWFMVSDPDGNLIQIFGPSPAAQ